MPGLLSSKDSLWGKIRDARCLFKELEGFSGRCIINFLRTGYVRCDTICNTAERVIEATESCESTTQDLHLITTLEDNYNLSPIANDMIKYVAEIDNILRKITVYEIKSQEFLVK